MGNSAQEPIVVALYKKFQVEANILFSNIEQLQGTTVGIMLLLLNGTNENINAAWQYLQQSQVEVKQIKYSEIEVD